jgi:hypothetical protein
MKNTNNGVKTAGYKKFGLSYELEIVPVQGMAAICITMQMAMV